MKRRLGVVTSLATAVLALPALLGLHAAGASTVRGDIALYVIAYSGAIDRAEADFYASSTNTWLRKQGVPADRADLSLVSFVSRSGTIDTECDVSTALSHALKAQDRAAIRKLQKSHDVVVPIVVAPNRDNCWFSGQAFIGTPGILLVTAGASPSERLRIFRHELGHNLGLDHFSTAELQGKRPQLLRPSDSMRVSEYGDPLSIMGHGTGLTWTDRLLLGVLPKATSVLASPQQSTYVVRGKGKRNRLLAIPTGNQVRVTLEYSPGRGLEARAIHKTGTVLWMAGGRGLQNGDEVMIADIRVTVLALRGSSATLKIMWPEDVAAPELERSRWEGPWDDFKDALEEVSGAWVSFERVDGPLSLDHTTVPTYVALEGTDTYPPALLPLARDAGWVQSTTLVINDDTVYQAVTDARSLTPAGTYPDSNSQPTRVGYLPRVPLYFGRNTLSYTVVDAVGNRADFHYVFTFR